MSTLSLAQSRSPSPTLPRTRSPSPRNNRQTTNPPDRSRPRTRQNFDGFKQYPGQNRPQSIMKRPFRNSNGRGRGRTMNRNRFQNRSRSYTRNKAYQGLDRCFNCNMVGHFARNCFTRTRTSLRTELTFQDVSLQILGKTRDEVIKGINNLVLDSKIRIPTDMHRIDTKMILSMVKELQTMLDI